MINSIKFTQCHAAGHSFIDPIDIVFKAAPISRFHPLKIKNICVTLVFLFLFVPISAYSDSNADFQLGVQAYIKGDIKTAVRKFKAVAEQGKALAQFNLGFIYAGGQGVPRDYKKSLKWYSLAAEQGLAEAQSNLGWLYRNGLGVQKDIKEAIKWYSLAAEQGQAEAQFNLGWMYLHGQGVPQDYARAHMWFNLIQLKDFKRMLLETKAVLKSMTLRETSQTQRLTREWRAKRRN